MTTSKKVILSAAIIFLIVPLYLFLLWIYACNKANAYPQNQQLYKSYLPEILTKGRSTIGLLSVFLCGISIIFSMYVLKNSALWVKLIFVLIIIMDILLILLNLWGMM